MKGSNDKELSRGVHKINSDKYKGSIDYFSKIVKIYRIDNGLNL